MKREYIPDGRFFRVSNFIFNYPLTPIERTVYFYLLCLAGNRGYCWPSVKTIADKCRCSPSAVRNAIKTLERQGFIKVSSIWNCAADYGAENCWHWNGLIWTSKTTPSRSTRLLIV